MIPAEGTTIVNAFALGEVRRVRYSAAGMMARIWRLDTSSGSYAVKEFHTVPDDGGLVSRLEVSTQLADAVTGAGVMTPRAVRTAEGELVLRIGDSGDTTPVFVAVSTWIEGRPLDLRRDAASAAAWLGTTAAAVELVPDPPGAPSLDPWLAGWLTTAPTETQWRVVLGQAKLAGRPWAELFAARIDQLVRLGRTVGTPTGEDESVLHTDLQPKNVLVTPSGFVLLDWDDAARCSRDRVLARTLIEWLTQGRVRSDLITRFMEAYRSRGGLGVIDDVTDFGYASAAFLNYLYELVTSNLSDDRESDHSIREVVAALSNPLSLATLEGVLVILHGTS